VTGALFLGVKRSVLEAEHPHPFSVEVKNEWSYNATQTYAFFI
jgi:hypothetical protein